MISYTEFKQIMTALVHSSKRVISNGEEIDYISLTTVVDILNSHSSDGTFTFKKNDKGFEMGHNNE